jgi:hypothetical protein
MELGTGVGVREVQRGFWWGNLKHRGHFEPTRVHGWVDWIQSAQDKANSMLYIILQSTFRFHKLRGLLGSQEGPRSMQSFRKNAHKDHTQFGLSS